MEVTAHKKESAKRIVMVFFFGVGIISASTSFGFFFNFFDALIPPSLPLIGGMVGSIISGFVGVLLFDGSTAVWLYAYLFTAETAQQRSTSLTMSALAFVGAAAASVAHLSLSAFQLDALTPEAKGWVSLGALIIVILGVVANFGAAINYQKNSKESQEAIRDSDRRDVMMENKKAYHKELDRLVGTKVREKLRAKAETLANLESDAIAQEYIDEEIAKYNPKHRPIPVNDEPTPARPSAPETAVYQLQKFVENQWQTISTGSSARELIDLVSEQKFVWRILGPNGNVIIESPSFDEPQPSPNGNDADFQ